MRAVTITALRAKMKYYFDLVSSSLEVVIVPRSNKDEDAIVIMSIQEYDALKETEYLLSTNANRKRLEESIQQMQAGKTLNYTIN